jgi:Mor family transcriptional regulator
MKQTDNEPAVAIEHLPKDYQAVARAIGIENAITLAKHVGGTSIYIPRIHSVLRSVIYRAVRKEFNGTNYNALAQKYGYTERWIRKIVKTPDLASAGN